MVSIITSLNIGVQNIFVKTIEKLQTRKALLSIFAFAVFLFGGTGFEQQIILTWMDGDSYAEQIVQRITASIDVKTQA